jgi:cytochrome b6-f complex iron-sulfur subunit
MSQCAQRPTGRRDFLGIAAIGTFLAAIVASLGGMASLVFPRAFPEPSRRYKIGQPGEFRVGEVRTPKGRNVFISRRAEGFLAVSAVCTHLGCIVTREPRGFVCPCHGSVFDADGAVIAGPAPTALAWYDISFAPDGQLVVDESSTVESGSFFSV